MQVSDSGAGIGRAQPDDDPTTLQLIGWGFDPAAQVLVDGQPVAQTQLAHWDRMVVTPALVQSPTGGKQVTVTVRNPDGSMDSMMLFLKTVLFNNPAKYTITLDATYTPFTVRVADLNKDGIADVAVSGQAGTAAGFIAVFLNPGDGHLPTTPLVLNLPSIAESIELADMDNDGARDIVVSTGMPSPESLCSTTPAPASLPPRTKSLTPAAAPPTASQ